MKWDVLAQVQPVEDIGSRVGLGSADLTDSTVRLMRFGLGFAALLATAVIIYGGVNYMGSGDSDVVKKRAKGAIFGGVVGLIVIFLAWAIVVFVIGTTTNVTTG